MSAPDWTTRVRPALNSRHISVLLVFFVLVANGLSLFLVDAASGKTPFLSNGLVWWISAHTVVSLIVCAMMAISIWQWRLEQFGALLMVFGIGITHLLLATYAGIATHSIAPISIRVLLWCALLIYLIYFGWSNYKAASKIYDEEKFSKIVTDEKADHFIFFQLEEVKIREKTGFKPHSNPAFFVAFILVGLGSYLIRVELTSYFNVNWIPIAFAIMAVPISTLGVMLITLGWQYFLFARRLIAQTGKPVYLNDMSKAAN